MLPFVVLLVSAPAVQGEITTRTLGMKDPQKARNGEFPFMLSIRMMSSDEHFCGATILTKNWVLTAAHCCKNRSSESIYLKAGTTKLDHGGENHYIEKMVMHENFSDSEPYKYDLCLFRVRDQFRFSKKVKPVILPTDSFNVDPGDRVTIAGWGKTSYNMKGQSTSLLKGTLTMIGGEECARRTNVAEFEGYICVTGNSEGTAACFGDSGGPIFVKGVQIGVVSWSPHPCSSSAAEITSRTLYYNDWIMEKLDSEHIYLNFYDPLGKDE